MSNTYFNPVKVLSGINSLEKLNIYVKKGTWLIISSRGFTSRGIINKLTTQLDKNIRFLIYDKVNPNPEVSDLTILTAKYRPYSLDGIIAIGGGSVLDTAKILSVSLASEFKDPINENLKNNNNQLWNKKIFSIAIPTTSGTGAEVTPFATLWDKNNNEKFSISSAYLFPDIAILDPILTITLPWRDTLYTGLDATSHALESLWNKNSSNISSLFSWEALKIISETLPRLKLDLENIQLRYKMQYASLMAGLAISQTKTAVAHGISYSITTKYGVPHGLACSFTLPYLIKDNYDFLSNENNEVMLKIIKMLDSLDLKDEIRKYIKENSEHVQLNIKKNTRSSNYHKSFDLQEILRNSL